MYLEIITPQQTLFKGDVDSVFFPGSSGDFQVLNNHAPIVSTLKEGQVKIFGNIKVEDNVREKFQFIENQTLLNIQSGTVEMNNNQITLLID